MQSHVRLHVDDCVPVDVDQQHGDDGDDDADSTGRADAAQGQPAGGDQRRPRSVDHHQRPERFTESDWCAQLPFTDYR